jgi:hypothetical protein
MKLRGRGAGSLLLPGVVFVFLVCITAAWAETKVVQAGDWQYAALDKLAQAGLLDGHPRGPLSAWAHHLSRYEAAALTLCAVEGLGKAYQQQGQALLQTARAEGASPAGQQEAASAGEEAAPPEGLSAENIAQVEKLIEEFRAELVAMGARVDDLAGAIKEAQTRLAKVEAERRAHQIDGYMQLRYRDDNATDGRREFQVRRVRVNVRGPVSEKASYRVEMQFDSKETGKGPGSKAQLRTAYIDYKLSPESRFRMGQAILPWGYELEESVPNLWTGERSLWMDRLFPDQRDIGAFVNYRRRATSPMFDIGLVNGTSIDAVDNNDKSNLLGRVDFPLKNGSLALSGYTGTNGEGTARTRQDRDGLSARYHWGETQFLGEWVTGNDRGKDVRGYYWQLGHPIASQKPNLLFVKYDQFDENRAKPDDLFRRWSLGYWYDLDKATRLTLVWELRDAGPKFSELTKWDGNAVYAQMQLKY